MGGGASRRGQRQRHRVKLLSTTGQRAIGRVLSSGHYKDCDGDDTYLVMVEYSCDGRLVTAKVAVKPSDQRRYRAGQRIGLTYVPGRPQIVKLDPPECALDQAS